MYRGIENSKNLSQLNILVVDEDQYSGKILRDALRWSGFRNLHFAQGAFNALERLKISSIDIAVVELAMSEFNGIEFTKIIRTSDDSPNKSLPIILITSDTRKQMIQQAITAGVEAILAKPVRPDFLQAYIKQLIESPFEYVQTKSYFGPCRRRTKKQEFDGQDRRTSDLEDEAKFEV